MKLKLLLGILMSLVCAFGQAENAFKFRGVVYDVGLRFTPESCSVDTFSVGLVKYDMSVISNILRANTVRIEGEEISRLVAAARVAHAAGLEIYFNPWKMNVGEQEVVAYMTEAAKAAEELRQEGIKLVFVAGCEYTAFNNGVLPGSSINERLASLMPPSDAKELPVFYQMLQERSKTLNRILSRVCQAVRSQFHGPVTYASGTWEMVDWSLFDIIGVDYYRDVQTDEEYVNGIRRYSCGDKPVVVMEVGCCAYKGAAKRGGAGFSILQGTTPDGKSGIYEGGVTPVRSEKEQADYIQTQIELLDKTDIKGVFVYVFSFPIMPYRSTGFDQDMTAYSLVKTYPADNGRSRLMPPWEPKEAFYRLAEIYRELELQELAGR